MMSRGFKPVKSNLLAAKRQRYCDPAFSCFPMQVYFGDLIYLTDRAVVRIGHVEVCPIQGDAKREREARESCVGISLTWRSSSMTRIRAISPPSKKLRAGQPA